MLTAPPPITLLDDAGAEVAVTERGLLSAAPAHLRWGSRGWPVVGWAGPWPVDEYWWDPAQARAVARLQVLLDGSRALLVIHTADGWKVEGVYD